MSKFMQSVALPDDLRNELAQLDWRLRWVDFVKGCGNLLFVTLAMAAVFLISDFFFPVPGVIRFGFLCVLTATLAWLFYQWLFIPLMRKRRWADLAYLIDRSFPELQERVSSTVELSMLDQQSQFSSEFMLKRLRRETDKRLSRIDMWDCLSLNKMAVALVAGIITALILSTPLLLNAGGYSLLWQRLLTPWANLDSATNLTFEVEEGDRTVPRGDDVFIVAKPVWRYREGKIPREINLSWDNERGDSESREMSYDQKKGAYVGKIPQVLTPLTYVLYGSGATSRRYSIVVADRPRLIDVRLTIQPPAYTAVKTTINEGAIGTIRAIQGSKLIAEVTFEHPVHSLEWRWSTIRDQSNLRSSETKSARATDRLEESSKASSSDSATSSESEFPGTYLQGVISPDGLSARIEAVADMSDSFVFRAVSLDDLENINEPARMIQIIPDRPPRIDISGDRDPIKVRPDDVIPISLSAEDDFGVQEVQIVIELLSAGLKDPELSRWNSEKTGEVTREVYDSYDLDLTDYQLENGDILGYRAVARDGRPIPEPNETWTSRRVLMISKDAAPLAGQIVEEFYDRMRRQIDAVKNDMTQHRRSVEQKRRELDPKPRDQAAETVKEQRPEWLQNELSLSLKLEELARNLRQRPITSELSKQNADPARKIIDEASKELEAYKESEKSDPVELVRNHEKSMRDAEKLLTRLRNQLDDAERIEQELVKIQQLARRARKLAKNAAQLSESGQQKPASQKKNGSNSETMAAQNSDSKPGESTDTATAGKASDVPEQPETSPLEQLQKEHAALSQDLDSLLKNRPELMQAAKNSLLSELAEIAEQADVLAQQQELLTESVQDSRQKVLEEQKDLSLALLDAEMIAEKLAAQSEKKSAQNAAPVFDAAPTKNAVREQKQANVSHAKQSLLNAQEALSRFMESQKTASTLPADTQQAARQLSEKTQQLASKIEAHQALAKNEPGNRQQLSEELAGLTQAIAALNIPPGLKNRQQDVLKKINRATTEFTKQTNTADDRLRESANVLKSLADQLKTPTERSKKATTQLSSLKKEADNLTRLIQENADKGAQADPAAVKGLAKKQLAMAKKLMSTDLVEQELEQQLAQTMQTAMKALNQLEAGQVKQAATSEKEFADQLDQLNQAVLQADKKRASTTNETETVNTTQADPWEKVKLPTEIKQIRFPKQAGTSAELKKNLAQIAQAQKQLQEKTEKAIQDHSSPLQANDQKRNLQQLSNQQKKLAEQTAGLTGKTALLPRMKAAQALQQASQALQQGDAKQSEQLQKEAASQLELAQQLLEAEISDPQAAETSSTDDLAKALDQKLKAIDQELAKSLTRTAKPTEPSDSKAANDQDNIPSAELEMAQTLEQLQQSQKLIANQTRQLAQQSEILQPDLEKLNQAMKQAAESAQQTSQKLQSGQFDQATLQAQQATQQLQQAQQQGSPDERSQAATKLLAEQQSRLAEQIAELAKNPQMARIAREQTQADLKQKTDALTQKLNQIANHSLSDPINDKQTGEKSENLSQQSAQAADQMQQAVNQSQQANLEQVEKQSRSAANQLQNLAKLSVQTSQMKRDTLVPEPVGKEASEASRMLDKAEELLKKALEQSQQQQPAPKEATDSPEASQQDPNNKPGESSDSKDSQSSQDQQDSSGKPESDSGQQPGSESSDQPPSAMEQLAQQLAKAAQALEQAHDNLQPSQQQSSSQSQQAQKPSGQGKPSEQSSDSETGNQTELSGDGDVSGNILRSALMRDWGERQGELEAELTDGRRRLIDQEYAPLIRRYFEALAQPEPAQKRSADEN